jgi:hypothetical protein
MTDEPDVLFVVAAPNDEVVAKLALALSALGMVTIRAVRAYAEEEYRQFVSPPPLELVPDLSTLRAKTEGLPEYASDSVTVHLQELPLKVVGGGSQNPTADLSLGPHEEATLDLTPFSAAALGFSYQQGLYHAIFDVHLTDGGVAEYSGSDWLPDTNFLEWSPANTSFSGSQFALRAPFTYVSVTCLSAVSHSGVDPAFRVHRPLR